MRWFTVRGLVTGLTHERVQAESAQEATENAEEAAYVSVCHQCSNSVDLDGVWGFIVEDDVLVLESRQLP